MCRPMVNSSCCNLRMAGFFNPPCKPIILIRTLYTPLLFSTVDFFIHLTAKQLVYLLGFLMPKESLSFGYCCEYWYRVYKRSTIAKKIKALYLLPSNDTRPRLGIHHFPGEPLGSSHFQLPRYPVPAHDESQLNTQMLNIPLPPNLHSYSIKVQQHPHLRFWKNLQLTWPIVEVLHVGGAHNFPNIYQHLININSLSLCAFNLRSTVRLLPKPQELSHVRLVTESHRATALHHSHHLTIFSEAFSQLPNLLSLTVHSVCVSPRTIREALYNARVLQLTKICLSNVLVPENEPRMNPNALTNELKKWTSVGQHCLYFRWDVYSNQPFHIVSRSPNTSIKFHQR